MKAVFVELPPFEANRGFYLTDDEYRILQNTLQFFPTCGDVIIGSGGLRKIRFSDSRRGKGKQGGVRVIYYWWAVRAQFLLFTVYGKGEMSDLTPNQKKGLRQRLGQHKAGK